jgi:uncharacterized DUF497 family protein
MDVTFDSKKSARNLLERGLPFERAMDFDFETATFVKDERRDYGEDRMIAIGYFERRLHVLCFLDTPGGVRVISFRKASERAGGRKYGKPQTVD